MKLLAISFLFLSLGAFSQKKEFFQIDSLPKEGILLDKGWKWHAGDNPDFAKVDFDDSKWEDINPILTIPELPNIDTRQPLWLRIKFNVTSKKNVAFSIKQSSASEIYLNGKLIKKYGKIGQSGNGTIAYVPFDEYLIPNLDSISNTLSIRIFFQEGIRYKQFQDIFYPLFTCQIHSVSQLPKYPHIDAYISEGFNIGFPLILFLVYFTIFLFYKPNKSNLWFSLWGASISLTAFLSLLSKLTTLISLQNSYTSWASIFSSFGTICLIFSIYLLLNQKRIWTIIGFIILITISTVNYFLPNNSDPRIFDFVILLFYIGLIVYMSLNAIKSGNEGGKYVIIGIVFFIVFWSIFIFDLLGFNKSTLIAAVNYHIAALSLPIIVATLLGLEFRNTNKSLLKNLEDVKKLSAEKQEILTTQNETLEKQVTERTAELVHKNRELEIEGALEKIRSTSLAMRYSDEIKNVVTVLFEKLKELNLVFDAAAIHVFGEGNKNASIWVASPEQLSSATEISLPYDEDAFENNPIILDIWNAKESGCHILNKIYPFELKNRYFNYVFKHNDYEKVPEFVRNIILNAECYTATFVSEKNSLLGVNSWTKQLFSATDFEILKRVARVFEQAYTRFLDLQKAEGQAREAQVEVALEKIRSRSLAMHHSNELNDVIAIMLDKLKELNVLLGTVALQFFDEKTKNSFLLVGSDLNEKPQMIYLPYDEKIFNEDTYLKDSWQAKISGESIINKKYSLEQKNKYFEYVFAINDLTVVSKPVRDFILQTQSHIICLLIEKNSALFVDSWHGQVYNEEMLKVLKRASIVFEQAYVRFLDLQKAEAQAREAQIEVALEKVRSRTMAMQHSSQLREIAATTLQQLQSLGFTYGACSIVIMDAITGNMTWWIQGFEQDYPDGYHFPYFEHPFYLAQLNNWKAGKKYAVMECGGDDKVSYDIYTFSKTEFVNIPVEIQNVMQAFKKITFSNAYMQYGALNWSTEPLSDEHAKILQRFANVFEQTYTRFLDLQKVEAQVMEAQIEAALERIRSRTMAMQQSNELAEAASILFSEVNKLGVNAFASVFHIWEPDLVSTKCWANGGEGLQPPLKIPHTVEPFHQQIYDAWKRGEQYFEMVAEGPELEATYRFMHSLINGTNVLENIENSGFNIPKKQFSYCSFFSHGYIMVNAYEKTNISQDVFIRFAKVFEQTYTRFLDLQKAEAQAREAQIEASLERIRSRAMAMNTSEELNTLIGFIYTECIKLNMQLDRGFIMTFDKDTKDAHWWMVSAEAPDMPISILVKYHDYAPNLAILKGWQESKQKWSYVLEGDNKETWDEHVFVKTDLAQLPDFVKIRMRSVDSIILNASFQNFGCIMLSSFEPLTDEHFDLLIRLSKVFDLTYTRFLDLQLKEQNAIRLMEEKLKLEHTLTELRATQAQLIQSEKLASLGELTAGIAHEIQNPLNFVNNFSELSEELIDEMNDEISKGKTEEVIAIAGDLKLNIEKIQHHGKRASGIVKAMLEHSRTSTGQKEPTDINALADEFLRLSYHGLRAKDKTFNSDFKAELDPNLPLIEVVPQDLGRVFLNLINNAFYACNERAKQNIKNGNHEPYKPMVIVSTQKTEDKIEIKVKDNGSGISEENIEKIFQPFFTTKPSGKGTGLGLSLSYDIVTKGHGGSLEVESIQGIGTTFIIKLPIT